MKKTLFHITITLVALLMQACTTGNGVEEADLTIICTTDLHGQILPETGPDGKTTKNHMAAISTYVKQLREQDPDGVMLFDTGDFMQGTPFLYYYNYINPREPHIGARALNYMHYDAIGIGNHDLEPGEITYRDHLPQLLEMPMLCANAKISTADNRYFSPYTIMERKGFRIAVIGLIAPESLLGLPKSAFPHITFSKMSDAARIWINNVKRYEHPDMIIGLLHAGMEPNTKIAESESVKELLEHVSGFDLLLLGHDHLGQNTVLNDSLGNPVRILQSLPDALEIGKADVHLKRENGKVSAEIKASTIDITQFPADQEMCDLFQKDAEMVDRHLDHELGEIAIDMDGALPLIQQCPLSDLIHAVQLEQTDAEISFASTLSTYGIVEAGPITMHQLFELYRYENTLFKLWMTGEEVIRFLEWGYGRQFATMHSAKDHLLAFVFGKNGEINMTRFGPELVTPHYNYTSAAGINYLVDVRKPVGSRVSVLSMADGTAFDPEKTYTIAISSYQATGGGGFIKSGLGWNDETLQFHTLAQSSKDIRYYLAQYIKAHSPLRPKRYGFWRVIPEEWHRDAAQKDLQMLLPYIRK